MHYLRASVIFTILCIINLGLSEVFAQNTAHSQVVIIGTVHNGNRYLNHNTLYRVLKNIKPDVILWEYSSEFRSVKGLLTYASLGGRVWEEQAAIQKYISRHQETLVLPYDTAFDRNNYLGIRPVMEKAIRDSLKRAYDTNRMTPEDKAAYIRYQQINHYMYVEIPATPLLRMNQPDVLDSNRLLHDFDRNRFISFIKNYSSDTTLLNWQIAENTFWEDRNIFMSRRILQHIKMHSGKKIVILTGLMHKYFLYDLLKPEADPFAFKLVEYYEARPAN